MPDDTYDDALDRIAADVMPDLAELLREVPADELPEFRAQLECATRNMADPMGRGRFSWAALVAIDAMLDGEDPDDAVTYAVERLRSEVAATFREERR